MELPPGFTVSQAGGVTYVHCNRCGEGKSEPHRPQVVLREWAATHECDASYTDPI